jgi:hypothetical protein
MASCQSSASSSRAMVSWVRSSLRAGIVATELVEVRDGREVHVDVGVDEDLSSGEGRQVGQRVGHGVQPADVRHHA